MTHRLVQYLHQHIHYLFIIFFSVGIVLFSIPWTQTLFFHITPLTLVGLAAVVFAYHREWTSKNLFVFLFIFLFSFLIEVIGVKTGHLFGHYVYQTSLGIKLFDVPLIIGVNWLVLSYGAHAIVRRLVDTRILRIIAGALLLVLYDVILEFAAPLMHMWIFEIGYPPIDNFIMWFVLGLIFQTGLELFQISTDNKSARALFIIQMIFFLIISIIGHMP